MRNKETVLYIVLSE